MKKYFFISFTGIILFLSLSTQTLAGFWDRQKGGANFFNNNEHEERYHIAKSLGIEFVRLAPNKWLNGRSKKNLGDFLIGRPDKFSGVVEKDIEELIRVLDIAYKNRISVVITMLSLPENRWSQHNQGKQQLDIWKSFKNQEPAILFWQQFAKKLKGHPAIVGYNIKNEPSPELSAPKFGDWATEDYEGWYKKIKGTPSDINLFYQKVVSAIRKVDPDTPIIVDSGFYATPWAFNILEPILNKGEILYSFHMYEPYAYTNSKNRGQYVYSGEIPTGEKSDSKKWKWNKDKVREFLSPIEKWQEKYKIPSNRILAGELGVYRYNKGAAKYLDDVISVIKDYGWHWAFYSFREDDWDGMDYELGTKPPGWKYWQAIEAKKMPREEVYNRKSELFDTIKKHLVHSDQ